MFLQKKILVSHDDNNTRIDVVYRDPQPDGRDFYGRNTPENDMAEFRDWIDEVMPSYRIRKNVGLVWDSKVSRGLASLFRFACQLRDSDCSICLSEFKDGEAIRVLTQCSHQFHVQCIDLWLYSHSSCPLCRADTPIEHIFY
ncbi:hypothetical protein ACOSQ3_033114 [Xanthoceras sorbifolium]